MDQLIGTRNCPHLGFELQHGRPCCHADDETRRHCGKSAPNPAAAAHQDLGVEAFFCTVLGTSTLPAEALKLAAREKIQARKQAVPAFRPHSEVSGHLEAKPSREHSEGQDPVIPTHTVRREDRQTSPNAPCPCGSGRKFKKCCGRMAG